MPFSLHFSDEFFGDTHNTQETDRPTNVADAIESMSVEMWEELAAEVFHTKVEYLSIQMIMDKIRETNTCSDLSSPVDVWIDEEGYFTVRVYEDENQNPPI